MKNEYQNRTGMQNSVTTFYSRYVFSQLLGKSRKCNTLFYFITVNLINSPS
jgi:hypothetical protein